MISWACLRKVALYLVVLFLASSAFAAESESIDGKLESYRLNNIQAETIAGSFLLRVQGSAPPTFTIYELFDPLRIVLDIADASFGESLRLPLDLADGPVSSVSGTMLDDKKPAITRLEIFLAEDRVYSVDRDANDIVISFAGEAPAQAAKAALPKAGEPAAPVAVPEDTGPAPGLQEAAAEPQPEMAAPEKPKPSPPAPQTGNFSFAGYTKQPISIDFYKIDLHNVFRLFGEISGMNIIITEGVAGTLTLALDNVPWDFALDIILSLNDLQKVERHGTLIIAPKTMTFNLPRRPADELSVKPKAAISVDKSAAAAESKAKDDVSVKPRAAMTPQTIEAQKLITRAQVLENEEDYDGAVALYEEAYALWPENSRLARQLASLYLVNQAQNAKAVHYAQKALALDQADRLAALYAAIGMANMKRNDMALEYFTMAVNEDEAGKGPPPAEALVSFAAFNEENNDLMAALLLLNRHNELYGENLESMIAAARIYDKEGSRDKAADEYRAILLSGYDLPDDLRRYIRGRLAMENVQQ